MTRISTLLGEVQGRHAIVLITDGYDEHSSATVDEAIAAVKNAHAILYVIGVGGVAGISLQGQQMLRTLADDSGGRAFFPARNSQLAETHDLVSSSVFHRYLITYTLEDQRPDGTWRAIALSTGDPDHTIRARDGYRSGPRNLDSGLSEISIVFQAAVPKLVASKYTTSGVRRPSEL